MTMCVGLFLSGDAETCVLEEVDLETRTRSQIVCDEIELVASL